MSSMYIICYYHQYQKHRKGTNVVSTNGVTATISCFLTEGLFGYLLPSIYFYFPKSARAYLFPNPSNSVLSQRRHVVGNQGLSVGECRLDDGARLRLEPRGAA